ncbi:Cysteine-rich membrane protein 2 [Spironucleus salmonicida]|uniref:Cysteine-rich membrane protein 2 n=1 Tax=Spironucleus salmonicida TaxID=348837 RepID=V6LU90_9EUKA|nr:Cysteine-rich membrane protein 2 [Spironucleus salmonicida]|eukprot:EST48177.1 Cysteine-rich membrane protein 2 [Spironucleus salmonicida]
MFILTLSVCVPGPGCYRTDLQGLCADTDKGCLCFKELGFIQGSGTDCTCMKGLKIGLPAAPVAIDPNSCYYNTSLGFIAQYKITIGLTPFLPDVCDVQRGFITAGSFDSETPLVHCACIEGMDFDDTLGTCIFDVSYGFLAGKQFKDGELVCSTQKGFVKQRICAQNKCSCQCAQGLETTPKTLADSAKCTYKTSFGFKTASDYVSGSIEACDETLGFDATGKGDVTTGFFCSCAAGYTTRKSDFHVKTCECDYNIGYFGKLQACKCYENLLEDASSKTCLMIINKGFTAAVAFQRPPFQDIVPSICDVTKGFKSDAVIVDNAVQCVCDDSLGFEPLPIEKASILTCECNTKFGFVALPVAGRCVCDDDFGFARVAPLPLSNLTCVDCRVGLELSAANFSCRCSQQLFYSGFYSTVNKCACLSGQIKDNLDASPLTCEPQVECAEGSFGCLPVCAGVACVCQKVLGFRATGATTCECVPGLLKNANSCALDRSKGFLTDSIVDIDVVITSRGQCDTEKGYSSDPEFRAGIWLVCVCDAGKGFLKDVSGCKCDESRGFLHNIGADFTCHCQKKLALVVENDVFACKCDAESGFRMVPFREVSGVIEVVRNSSNPLNCECEWVYGFVPNGDACKCDSGRQFVANGARCDCQDQQKINVLGNCECGFVLGLEPQPDGTCSCAKREGFFPSGEMCQCAKNYKNIGGFCKCDGKNEGLAMYEQGERCPCRNGFERRGGRCAKRLNWVAIGVGTVVGVLCGVLIALGVYFLVKKYQQRPKIAAKTDLPKVQKVKKAKKAVKAFGRVQVSKPQME